MLILGVSSNGRFFLTISAKHRTVLKLATGKTKPHLSKTLKLSLAPSRQMPVYCDEHHEAELECLSARRGRMETGQTRTGSRGRSHRLQISGSLTPCRRRPGSWTGRVSYTENRSDWTKILLEFINRSDLDSEAVRKLIAGRLRGWSNK